MVFATLMTNFAHFYPTCISRDYPKTEIQVEEKLSPIKAKALSQHGLRLSKLNGDHEGAIDMLMKALKNQTNCNGVLNKECAVTLSHLGDVFMRRAKSSSGDDIMKDAKRAEYCFIQAADIYYNINDRKSMSKIMKQVNSSKRLQLIKRRRISFKDIAPDGVLSSSSISSENTMDSSDDETAVSDITRIDNYSSEYYRKHHLVFLRQSDEKSDLGRLLGGSLCSCFCHNDPMYTIEFVEQRLDDL